MDYASASQPRDERRETSDRRTQPTSPWGALPPAGRRRGARRADERRLPHFVDRFSVSLLCLILLLLIATLLDAVFTIRLIAAGGSEINPLMSLLLERGFQTFLVGKYLLTVVGLPLLLIFKNHYLFGTRFRAGYFIPIAVVLYAILIVYQLCLMMRV